MRMREVAPRQARAGQRARGTARNSPIGRSVSASIYMPTTPVGATHTGAGGRLRARLAVMLMLVLCLGLGWWLLAGSTWQNSEIRLVGTDDATVQVVVDALHLRGQNILHYDLGNDERLIATLPVIAAVHAYKVYPNSVLFKVTVRQPALRWHTRTQTLVIARDGTVLGLVDASHASEWGRLQMLDDPSSALFAGQTVHAGERLPSETVEMAVQLLKGISGSANAPLTYVSGQGFTAISSSGQRIVFGTATDTIALLHSLQPNSAASGDDVTRGVALQLQELSQLRTLLARQQIDATLIDLRWGPDPYYRTN